MGLDIGAALACAPGELNRDDLAELLNAAEIGLLEGHQEKAPKP